MTLDLLITTMHQKDFSLLDKMNISSNAIIANQCNRFSLNEINHNGFDVKMISTLTRGKSINQNIGLLHSKADLILFSDDDLIFDNNYLNVVLDFFDKHKDADAVKFFCESSNEYRPLAFKKPKEVKKIHKHSLMSAGTPGLVVKKDFLEKHNIFFNIKFGPGSICPFGEDSIFITSLFKNGANVYASPYKIAVVMQENSSWFNGYDSSYFKNIGKVYKMLYGRFLGQFAAIKRALKLSKNKQVNKSVSEIFHLIDQGILDK